MDVTGGPYYVHHRGIHGSVGSGGTHPGLGSSQGFRPTSSNPNHSGQVIVRSNNSSLVHGFNVEESPVNVPQEFSMNVGPTGGSLSESVKKKRGRPRKYGPDGSGLVAASGSGSVALGLSPSPSTPNSDNLSERKKRGRPLGSGRKQRLASVGEWMNNSAGAAFAPHVIHVDPGEDIASKILSFAQQRPRAVCVMSGSGGVSAVTLRQPVSSTKTVSFEDPFEILSLSGSYLLSETGASRDRVGGVNVLLSSPDGQVVGGAVGGELIASKPVQVVVCSFVYTSTKAKSKEYDDSNEKSSEQLLNYKTSVHMNASHSENVAGSWPGSRAVDQRNPNIDIDLASG